MKKLLMVADESIIAGCARCGVAELVDSLANAMTPHYEVYVVCPHGTGTLLQWGERVALYDEYDEHRFLNVTYYTIHPVGNFDTIAAKLVDMVQPDIFHNFANPAIIDMLSVRPKKTVYTIDRPEVITGKVDRLQPYDWITTCSVVFADILLSAGNELSWMLKNKNFRGITNGILTPVFDPDRGLLLAHRYNVDDLHGKTICKRHLCRTYGIPEYKSVYLMMCRLIEGKGIEDVLSVIHQIRDAGGFVLFVGRGEIKYEQMLRKLTKEDGAFWTKTWASPIQTIPLFAGADFFFTPSAYDVCPLMPMTASRYGAIPIVTTYGGLQEAFNNDNAIVIGEEGISEAVERTSALYANKLRLAQKRKAVMQADHSWNTRKQGYLEVYEA